MCGMDRHDMLPLLTAMNLVPGNAKGENRRIRHRKQPHNHTRRTQTSNGANLKRRHANGSTIPIKQSLPAKDIVSKAPAKQSQPTKDYGSDVPTKDYNCYVPAMDYGSNAPVENYGSDVPVNGSRNDHVAPQQLQYSCYSTPPESTQNVQKMSNLKRRRDYGSNVLSNDYDCYVPAMDYGSDVPAKRSRVDHVEETHHQSTNCDQLHYPYYSTPPEPTHNEQKMSDRDLFANLKRILDQQVRKPAVIEQLGVPIGETMVYQGYWAWSR